MRKFLFTIMFVVVGFCLTFGQNKVGWWKFDDSTDLTKAEIGNPLVKVGNSISPVAGPNSTNGAATVALGSYFEVVHKMVPKGNEKNVNRYSLVIDFKVPKLDTWYCFFQTDITNKSDGDCFIDKTGHIGTATTGYSSFSILPNEWYRLVVSVDLGQSFKYYLDGNLIKIGNNQFIDDRFSLLDKILLFADDDGDDGNIDISEVSLYDGPLNDSDVLKLGGYGHTGKYVYDIPVLKPFLQTPGQDYMYVSWHDTSTVKTIVEYGLSESLGSTKSGTHETINRYPYIWHTVKLTDLKPGTKYFYKVISGSGTSPVYSFNTQPDIDNSKGHVRFLIFGDTQQNPNLTKTIVDSSVTQLKSLFGKNYADSLNFIMHTGDCIQDANNISSYTDEFLHPMEPLSCNLPFAISAGNHELDSPNFFSYMKFDDISAFSSPAGISERFWSFKVSRTLYVGLDFDISYDFCTQEKKWFSDLLQKAENDNTIDQVFCFVHRCPYSELWPDGESSYSKDVLGIMQQYSKSQQLSYGHTHAFETGVVPSLAANTNGDIRYVCVGGGGGDRDYFSSSAVDLSSINMSVAQNFFVLADVDVKNKSNTFKVYGVGDLAKNPVPKIALMDSWYHKFNQTKPLTPSCVSHIATKDSLFLLSTPFSGVDSLMSVQLQATMTPGNYSSPILDVTRDWRDIYGVKNSIPFNVNKGINLIRYGVSVKNLNVGTTYGWKVRYRDHNLKWSNWSDEQSFVFNYKTGITDNELGNDHINIVNPILDNLTLTPSAGMVVQSITVYDMSGRAVLQHQGDESQIDARTIRKGICIVKVKTSEEDYYFKCIKY